jgi:hypothetical protein
MQRMPRVILHAACMSFYFTLQSSLLFLLMQHATCDTACNMHEFFCFTLLSSWLFVLTNTAYSMPRVIVVIVLLAACLMRYCTQQQWISILNSYQVNSAFNKMRSQISTARMTTMFESSYAFRFPVSASSMVLPIHTDTGITPRGGAIDA